MFFKKKRDCLVAHLQVGEEEEEEEEVDRTYVHDFTADPYL